VAETYAIVVGRFYEDLARELVAGATRVSVEVFDVPGAYELPLAAKYAADSGRFTGVACVGAVIRGETTHYDYVCGESARGIMRVALDTGVPTSFGVLTVENIDQAWKRLGGEGAKRHEGEDAANAVLAMAALRAQLASAS
jgi:6,7-dimethyl-8-ribityllumazine synthase